MLFRSPGASISAPASAPTSVGVASSGSSVPTTRTSALPVAGDKASEMKAWYLTKMKRDDKDGNGFLTTDEVSDVSKFTQADANKDGRIDLDEYIAMRGKGK